MQLEHDLKCAAHPPDQPGHLISNCPICAEGADAAKLRSEGADDAVGDEASPGAGQSQQLVQPVTVRRMACVQVSMDGFFKLPSLEACGYRKNTAEMTELLSPGTIMTNVERDHMMSWARASLRRSTRLAAVDALQRQPSS